MVDLQPRERSTVFILVEVGGAGSRSGTHLDRVPHPQLPPQRRLVGQAQPHLPVHLIKPRPSTHNPGHCALGGERGGAYNRGPQQPITAQQGLTVTW